MVRDGTAWRLVGIVNGGNEGLPAIFTDVSDYRSWIFQTLLELPVELSTANNSTLGYGSALDWQDYANASQYFYQISTTPDFMNNLVTGVETKSFHSLLDNLNPDTTYYWRVWAGRDEESSPFSETRVFRTPPLPAVPPPPPPPATGDTTLPTASGFSPSVNGGTVNLAVSGVSDSGSGVQRVNYSAKYNNSWRGIGSSTAHPYSLSWNMCTAGVPDGDVELGMEVIDNAGNKFVWSTRYPNPHVTKNYNCTSPTVYAHGIYLYRNDGLDSSRGGECYITQDIPSIGNYCEAHCQGSTCGGSWNDEVESVRTTGPYFVALYRDDWYGGGEPLSGNFTSRVPDNWKNQASSARVRKVDPVAVSLHSLGDMSGEEWKTDRTIFDMAHWAWNDKARSIRVYSGYSVIVCADSDFHGICGRGTGPNQWSDINALANGLHSAVSSIRVCSGSCPSAGATPTLTQPANGATVASDRSVVLMWSGSLTEYYIEVWGGALTETRRNGWTGTTVWDLGLLPASPNAYYWHVRGHRGYGETGWADGSFYVNTPDRTPPTGKITVIGSVQSGSIVTLQAEASDTQSAVLGAMFYAYFDGGWRFLNTDLTAPFTYEWQIPVTLPEGPIWLSVSLGDTAGNWTGILGASGWKSYTIDRTPPESWFSYAPTVSADPQFRLVYGGKDNYTPDDLLLWKLAYQTDCAGEWKYDSIWDSFPATAFIGESGHTYCFRLIAMDLNYNQESWSETPDAIVQVLADKQEQTINFVGLSDRTLGDPPFQIDVTASSGLPVSFCTFTPAVCTIAGQTVTLVAQGTCTLAAQQIGNTSYLPAPDALQSFTVLPAESPTAVPTSVPTSIPTSIPNDTSNDNRIYLPAIMRSDIAASASTDGSVPDQQAGFANFSSVCPGAIPTETPTPIASPTPTPTPSPMPTPTLIPPLNSITWSVANKLPIPSAEHAVALADGYAFLTGGYGAMADSTYSARLSDDTPAWTKTSSFQPGRWSHQSAVVNNHLYVLGGYPVSTREDQVLSAPINTDHTVGSWSRQLPLPPLTLYRSAAVVYNGDIYILGGFTYTVSSDIYRAHVNADGSLGNWQSLASLPLHLHAHSAVVYGNYVFVIGGATELDSGFSNRVYRGEFQPDGNISNWIQLASLPSPVVEGEAIVFKDHIVVLGGRADLTYEGFLSSVFSLSLQNAGDNQSWISLGNLPERVAYHASFITPDNRILTLGGITGVTVNGAPSQKTIDTVFIGVPN